MAISPHYTPLPLTDCERKFLANELAKIDSDCDLGLYDDPRLRSLGIRARDIIVAECERGDVR